MKTQTAVFYKALGDETRQAILEYLLQHDEICVGELCDLLESIAQPTLSHHLQILKSANVVSARKEGKMVYYQVNRKYMTQMGRLMITEVRITREF